MRSMIREWFSTVAIVAAFTLVGTVALSMQVQQYRDQQASDAALAAPGRVGLPPSARH